MHISIISFYFYYIRNFCFQVGIAATQLAKAHGMRVIGTAGSEAGLKLVREQGADYVFNHKDADHMKQIKDINPEGLELILEMIANVNLDNDIQILRWKKGRVVVIGNRGTVEVISSKIYS